MKHHANVARADPGGFGDLFVGEVFEEKGDERFFDRVQFVDRIVKARDAVVGRGVSGLAGFDCVGEIGVFKVNDAVGAGGSFANEGNGGVDGDAIKPGVGELDFFKPRQAAPDLAKDFLVEIVLVSGVPCVHAADA